MDYCFVGLNRCSKAIIFLIFFSFSAYSYNPPATPDLPLQYDFSGSTAEAEANEFRLTQCDSQDFSWYSTGMVCANGDPQNIFCSVFMAYHSTDVNNCKNSLPAQPPQFPVGTDSFQDGTGTTQNMASLIKGISEATWSQLAESNDLTRNILSATKQSNNLLSSVLQTMNNTGDRAIVDAINTMRGSIVNQLDNNHVFDYAYNVQQDEKEKVMFEREMGFIGTKLNYMHDTLESIDNKSGSGSGGGSDWPVDEFLTQIYRIGGAVENVSGNTSDLKGFHGTIQGMNGMLSYLIPEQSNLLRDINASIKALGGGSSDDSAILEQFEEANNQLSDIVLRMRDIENAIGKSEKGIVDAIENGVGNGSETDSISENGCVSFQCTSNTPACYIARKEWEKSCSAIAENNSNNDGISSLTNQLSDFINHPDSDIQNIDAGRIDTTALINHYGSDNGVNIGGSSTCPAPITVDIRLAQFTLDLTPFCDLALIIRWFVITFTTVAAGLMIAKYS